MINPGSNVYLVLSDKLIGAHFKYFWMKTHVQTAHESHDLIMDFRSFNNGFKQLRVTNSMQKWLFKLHADLPSRARNQALVWIFIYIKTLCKQAGKALASQGICPGSPEPSLLYIATSTQISCAGSYKLWSCNSYGQWRSQKAEKAMHIKGRLLDQAVIQFNCIPFHNGNFS